MKFITILGARPQFIKAAPVSRELRKQHTELIVHTGQHYDKNMSDIFFKELNIPKPDYNLEIGSSSHGKQTGRMLEKIEDILLTETPDYLLVYGDTNSTLAGALAACKLHIPVVHVEAGLRSFNKRMPEEINRIMTDHVSEYLFCPTETAVKNLENENVDAKIINVGDVMYDAVEYNRQLAETQSRILKDQQIESGSYHLLTVHRAENTDDPIKLSNILEAFAQIEEMKVWPLHPRTKNKISEYGLELSAIPNLKIIEPVGYLDMLKLESNAKKILTDSGGVQKEAYFVQVPCVTMREQTEWVETLEDDANILVGTNTNEIVQAVLKEVEPSYKPYFGSADAAEKIVDELT
ncbi:non-hydrolyzing UDP-N-acetylglucosamine 2-epimerase [Bacillus sp. Marseille-Q3570]|uniref:non-hydrolyzing UDP-N-acetylglucosamine 2-epimerase n=1 Tax=Bacillus sp. Marseille-Q3570 TaxID=2963522 RepID=UPI0021B6EA74|nr:UDP-N-acetylglucosamine 2-epimerase (non-hydrolyzing) [Bacillus sp. Marseille-Q3570]